MLALQVPPCSACTQCSSLRLLSCPACAVPYLAVHQIVAQRQRDAEATREQAAAAVERLKSCMTGVLNSYASLLPPDGSAQCCSSAPAPTISGDVLYDAPQPFPSPQPLMPSSSGGTKALLEPRGPWGHMDHEHVSLVDSDLFGGAADSGAALFNVDAFGSSLIRVRN